MNWMYWILLLDIGVLVYAYVAFPTLVAMFAKDEKDLLTERRSDAALPSVTIVIPAHDEEAVIGEKIRNCLALDYPALEVIVGADGCRDSTASIVESFAAERVRLLAFPSRRGKTAVLNEAAAHANGQVLCFCDANVLFRTDSLRWMAARISADDVGAVSGDVRLQSEVSSFGLAELLYYWIERRIQRGESRFGAMMGVDGGMYLVKRERFAPLPPDTILDDFTISMNVLRAGYKVVYEPRAIATESATESAASEFKRRVRINAGVAQVLARGIHPRLNQLVACWLFLSHKLLRWLSPWLLLSAIFLLGFLASRSVWCFAFFSVAMLLIAAAAVGAVSIRLRRRWIFSVPFYFVMSQVAMAIGLVKGGIFTQEAIWERTRRHSHVFRERIYQDAK